MLESLEDTVSFIVCSNGYGHLKRVLLVVNELLQIEPALEINVFCTIAHLSFIQKAGNFSATDRIFFHSDLSINEPNWTNSSLISYANYKSWSEDLLNHPVLSRSGVIITDNQVLPSIIFPNSIVMGSFLWYDVVPSSTKDLKEIVDIEKKFVRTQHPMVICLDDLVMPELVQHTNCRRLPWFTKKYRDRFSFSRSGNFLITGGGTKLLSESLLEIAFKLSSDQSDYNFFLDSGLYNSCCFIHNPNLHLFEFTESAFSSLNAVICRPGVGILTDCVTYSLPILSIYDSSNKEIIHNSLAVSSLGIGVSFNIQDYNIIETANKISAIISNNIIISALTEKINDLETGGAIKAASIILEELNKFKRERIK